MTLQEARSVVLKKYPQALGWREFTVSDYIVKTKPGGEILGAGWYARAAWENAAKNCLSEQPPYVSHGDGKP